MVPSQFLGSHHAGRDEHATTRPRRRRPCRSARYKGQTLTLSYPTDATLSASSSPTLAQKVQSKLQAAGITVKLSGTPISTLLDAYRAGKLQAGLMYWGPDFPDPSDYMTFSPGEASASAPAGPRHVARGDEGEAGRERRPGDARAAAYQAWQRRRTRTGAFVPLLQPAQLHRDRVADRHGVSRTRSGRWTWPPSSRARRASGDRRPGRALRAAASRTPLVRYIAIRLALSLAALVGVTIVTFVLTNLVPASPVTAALGERASSDPKIVAAFKAAQGLDKPLPVQYVVYLGHLLQGNLGTSIAPGTRHAGPRLTRSRDGRSSP